MAGLYRKIICADGFSMSVQAGEHNYSHPRVNDARRYFSVEIGYPSEKETLIIDYAENPERPTETVYGWVPAAIISLICAKHGGIVSGDLPKGIPYLHAK
tara:strand:+ start:194 stop:493 length:300 start_codon:yes stop_codon:yes gene_type:complete